MRCSVLETVEAVPESHSTFFFRLHKPIDLRFDKTSTLQSPYGLGLSIIIGLQPDSRFIGGKKDLDTRAQINFGQKLYVSLFVCLSNSDYRR
jgi:hypothetical protein